MWEGVFCRAAILIWTTFGCSTPAVSLDRHTVELAHLGAAAGCVTQVVLHRFTGCVTQVVLHRLCTGLQVVTQIVIHRLCYTGCVTGLQVVLHRFRGCYTGCVTGLQVKSSVNKCDC
jgi:hypothetical protein